MSKNQSNKKSETKMNETKKSSNLRRHRGYAFENSIVIKINNASGWTGKRLGSPSVALPDVMGINNIYKTVIAIEAKSTHNNLVYVPQDQVERCRDWVNQFGVYDNKIVILAFKFGQIPGKRKLTYYYKIFPHKSIDSCEVKGDQYGKTWRKIEDQWVPLVMEDFKL